MHIIIIKKVCLSLYIKLNYLKKCKNMNKQSQHMIKQYN